MKNVVLSKMSYWLLLVLMALPMGVYGNVGDVFSDGMLKYKVLTEGDEPELYTVEVSRAEEIDNITEAIIPASVTNKDNKSYKVVGIGSSAFNGCTKLTSVTIGKNITTIGKYAFNDSGLLSVEIPENVEAIGEQAFASCKKMTSAKINANIARIPKQAFAVCSDLTTVVLSSTVTTIGEQAFYQCIKLASCDLSYITTIEKMAFYYCAFTSLVLPQTLANIGESAFHVCTKLAKIYTDRAEPATLGTDAFSYTDAALSIYVPKDFVGDYQQKWSEYSARIVSSVIITVNPSNPTEGGTMSGSYTENGTAGTLQPGDNYILTDTKITLNNAPSKVYTFKHYLIDNVESPDPDTKVTADANMTISAVFERDNTVKLITLVTPVGGNVIGKYNYGSGDKDLIVGENVINNDTEITLTHTTVAGYKFKTFTVDGTPSDNTVIANADKKISAVFVEAVNITLEKTPTGGTVSGTDVEGKELVNGVNLIEKDTEITLKAQPGDGYKFKQFTVDGNPSGNKVVASAAKTISAEFEKDSPTPPVPPTVWYNVRVPATQGVLFTCNHVEADSINLDVLDRGSLTFYIKLKPDYAAEAIKVTTNRGEVLLPRDSDNKYIVNDISENVQVKVEGVHPTGNEAINADQVKVWTSNGELHIQAPAQEKVHIVTFAGALLKQLTTTGGHTSVALAPGNYIVRVGNQSFKVNL